METHYEKDLVINGRELRYHGIFRVDELFKAINQALEEKGYEKREKKTEEIVTEEGKRTFVELRPLKLKTNYVTLMVKLRITLDNVTEAMEDIQGGKKKFQQGDILIIFDAWYLTDYRDRWNMKPVTFFLKGLVNKFLYQFPLEAGFRNELVADTAFIYAQVQKLLKSYRREPVKIVSDKEVMAKVAEEIGSAEKLSP